MTTPRKKLTQEHIATTSSILSMLRLSLAISTWHWHPTLGASGKSWELVNLLRKTSIALSEGLEPSQNLESRRCLRSSTTCSPHQNHSSSFGPSSILARRATLTDRVVGGCPIAILAISMKEFRSRGPSSNINRSSDSMLANQRSTPGAPSLLRTRASNSLCNCVHFMSTVQPADSTSTQARAKQQTFQLVSGLPWSPPLAARLEYTRAAWDALVHAMIVPPQNHSSSLGR